MRRGMAAVALIGVMALALFWTSCGAALAAEEVTIQDLVGEMGRYDGREVTITGEAVGDIMMRGEYGWVTVNDDEYAKVSIEEGGEFAGYSNLGISVWAPRDELERIGALGGYKNKGDRVRVTGTFHRACPEHGGDTDIHASRLEILERGHAIPHPLAWWKLALALALAAITLVLAYFWRKKALAALSPMGRR